MRVHGTHAVVDRDGSPDAVAVEEPLEIRVGSEPVAVTMPADLAANTIEVRGAVRAPAARRFYTTSSCGVCGKGALDEVRVHVAPLGDGPIVARALLAALPGGLRQPGFERTGGMHATGLFTDAGELLCVREDVGRHNAMDKVVGRALLDGALPLAGRLLCVSGRLSFELVQKAAVAGAPVLVGVGAPTSLAFALAEEVGLTLAGFARGDRVNVYAGAQRVA